MTPLGSLTLSLVLRAHGADAPPEGEAPREGWVHVADPRDAARAAAVPGVGFLEAGAGGWRAVEGDLAALRGAGLRVTGSPPPEWWAQLAQAHGPAHARALREGRARPGLPTFDEVQARIEALTRTGARRVDVGQSVLGAPIVAVVLGDPAGTRTLRVLGGHHGDEGSSVEVALALAERAHDVGLPPDVALWVVPLVNPDGAARGRRHNARDVDLNRNYGFMWRPDAYASGDGPFSEPETRAVRALSRARGWLGGLSLHSGATNFGWVWNWTRSERPPEEPSLRALGESYAEACSAPGFWLTNGADWYVTHGDTTDWTYGARGEPDVTLELTVDKAPPAEQIDAYVAWHLDALLEWAARPADLALQVRDAVSGAPLEARVLADGMRPGWTGPDGRWARWTESLPARLRVEAPGYAPAEVGPDAAEVRLARAGLLVDRPEPRLLGRVDGLTRVRLAGVEGGALRLVQPGEADVTLPWAGDGWDVDPEALAPGAWTLVTEAGSAPRALFVGEVDDAVRIDDVDVGEQTLTLRGEGFARGAEAWALAGEARAMVPVARLAEDARSITLARPLGVESVDLLVWTAGRWLTVLDATGAPEVDDAAPADLDPTLRAPGVCGLVEPSGAAGAWVVGAVLLARRRRARGAAAAGEGSSAGC